MSDRTPFISVRDLKKYYDTERDVFDRIFGVDKQPVKAVDGVSFDIYPGETLGLVGESGCGKSTTGTTLLNLEPPTGGHIEYKGTPLDELSDRERREYRRNTQIVFQEPFSSLNPRMTIGQCIAEPLRVHDIGDKADRADRVDELLRQVGLSVDYKERYAHEFSGGQCQRIAIARSLALEPEFIVLDEPVSALDVSVQAQILNLLDELQAEHDFTYLFIAHDLSVIKYICDRVAVMYLGKIVEIGPVDRIFDDPEHPYTQALLENISRADPAERDREVNVLSGDVPSPRTPPSGCRFRTRCPKVIPPTGYDIDQATWRRVMDFRQAIEQDAVDRDTVIRSLAIDETIPDADHWDRLDPDEQEALLRDYFDLPDRLPDAGAEAVLSEAVEHLRDDRTEEAARLLADELPTPCERDVPELERVDDAHQAACHLITAASPRDAAVSGASSTESTGP